MTITDLEITRENTPDGCYDLVIAPNGDLAQISGFDTSLIMSLFCERRADESEIPAANLRRGWWGNTVSDDAGFEIGSKLWIVIEQPRKLTEVMNRAIKYIQDGLQWLVDDGYLDQVIVGAVFSAIGLQANIQLLRSQSVIDSKYYDLWQSTGNLP